MALEPTQSGDGDPGRFTRVAEEFIRLRESGRLADLDEFCGRYPEDQRAGVRRECEQLLRIQGAMAQDDRLRAGQTLGPYEIVEPIGKGGMGEVYRARDRKLDRDVAIKVLPRLLAREPDRVKRFEREAKAIAALDHPNIITIHSVEEADGVHFITMQLVQGRTLQDRIRPGGLPMAVVLDLAVPLAEGLAAAHGSGIVHRDLKPGNVMVDDRGQLRILDFGLSKMLSDPQDGGSILTASHQVMGTPLYMSPEQVRGEATDHRSDLFSVGSILYELATGVRPFHGETPGQVMDAVLNQQPPPPQRANPRIDDDFARLVERLLEKDPGLRLQTSDDLVAALQGLGRKKLAPRRSLWVRAGPWAALAAAAVVLVLLTLPSAQKQSLAILPFAVPSDDPQAASIARALTYNLPQALIGPDVEVIPASYLTALARREGSAQGVADLLAEAELARAAGASLMLVGSIRADSGDYQVQYELFDCRSMDYRGGQTVTVVSGESLAEEVERISDALREPLGIRDQETGLNRFSESPEGWIAFGRGEEAMGQGDWTEAASHFATAIDADPDFALAHYRRAAALSWRDSGVVTGALAGVEEALARPERLTPDVTEKARLVHAGLSTTPFWQAPGMLEQARRLAADHGRDPEAQEIWLEYAIHNLTEGSPREAIVAGQSALALRPDSSGTLFHVMQASAWASRGELNREAAEQLMRHGSNSTLALAALVALDRRDEAKRLAEELGRNPTRFLDRAYSLETLINVREPELAEEVARLGWGSDRDSFSPGTIYALLMAGRFADARIVSGEQFRRAQQDLEVWGFSLLRIELGMDPGAVKPEDPVVSLFRAVWLARQGEPDQAQELLPGLSEETDPPQIRRLRRLVEGEIAEARGETSRALLKFTEAAPARGQVENQRVGTQANFFIERVGRALVAAGQFEDAERWLLRFEEEPELLVNQLDLSLAVFSVRAQYGLARCREAAGDRDGALEYYDRFLTTWSEPDDGFPEIADALARYEALAGEPWSRR